jgi:hypothetical protein
MNDSTSPGAVRSFIAATNSADDAAFVAVFTEDAYINDWGREFRGHEGVAAWNRTDNIGAGMRFELVSTTYDGDDVFKVTLKAASRRFNGIGTMRIAVRGGLITRLEIGWPLVRRLLTLARRRS